MIRVSAYLAAHTLHRARVFLEHWYVGGLRVCANITLSILERLERVFAVAVTLRHFFEPLYQDRTFIGYVLGFVFRTLRVFVGALFFAVAVALAGVLYLAWALVLPFVLIQVSQLLS